MGIRGGGMWDGVMGGRCVCVCVVVVVVVVVVVEVEVVVVGHQ